LIQIPEISGFEVQYVDEFQKDMVYEREDGNGFQCTLCGAILTQKSVAKTHVLRMHITPEYYQCNLCYETIKHKFYFRKHISEKHFKGGKNLIKNYALLVPRPDNQIKIKGESK
jgi:hypothetical protein